MKPIFSAWNMQLDVTSLCDKHCIYCSRYNQHLRPDQRYNMDLDYFDSVLTGLKNWPAVIGIIGGEPLLHPQFIEICDIMQKHFPKEKYQLFTSHKVNFEKYRKKIDETFAYLAYNEHNEQQKELCKFQPLTVAIEEAVKDENLRKSLINDCWLQQRWCPSVNNKGGFFCEVAAAMDTILEGPGGYDITDQNWWNKNPEQFQDQVDRYCHKCGMAIPMERELIKNTKEKFTPKLLQEFKDKGLKRLSENEVEVFDKEITKKQIVDKLNSGEWQPWKNRGDLPNGEA